MCNFEAVVAGESAHDQIAAVFGKCSHQMNSRRGTPNRKSLHRIEKRMVMAMIIKVDN